MQEIIKGTKLLGRKAYGSIPHLPGSRLGQSESTVDNGQLKTATEQSRDRHDVVHVQEKVDGGNVAVAKQDGDLVPLTRKGRRATESALKQHHMFHEWVLANRARFDALLGEGERACGEWMVQAHGTRYNLPHEPFVLFDVFRDGGNRLTLDELVERGPMFAMPRLLHTGAPISVEEILSRLDMPPGGGHGALDLVEGAVWRVERHEPRRSPRVLYLAKMVRQQKVDGWYLFQDINPAVTGPTWNQYPPPGGVLCLDAEGAPWPVHDRSEPGGACARCGSGGDA